jgi:hypothetical protein
MEDDEAVQLRRILQGIITFIRQKQYLLSA